MSVATLTINSRNYGAWALRGWLLCKFAGLDFGVEVVDHQDPGVRDELLLLSPSFLVPRLEHDELVVWDTLAIGEYLYEILPESSLLPEDPRARARCRSVSGEVHSGFANLRSALPMNIKAHHPSFPVWAGVQADVDRIETVWNECLATSGGPFLFGSGRTLADAMYAPVCTRLETYDVKVGAAAAGYAEAVLAMPEMVEWIDAARREPDDVEELEMEF
ncbi:MAG TPA: glutathione S-transferase [Acidimicrobiales bacterium]|nr:glutathione S-transferase [Acidimicrobiales bacterium]